MNEGESETMADETLDGFLEALASAAPAPGGGAAAAVQVALGASLVSMVANLTIGKPRYAEHEATMVGARDEATRLRRDALGLADADAVAFTAVTDAYRLPKETVQDKAARTAAIQQALIGAAEVPLRTAAAAAEVVGLCQRILDGANVNVLSDVAVAAASARAALDSAAINVRINLASMTDAATRDATAAELDKYLSSLAGADSVVRAVGDRIGS
nr:cyclodeaminase/cyclohydrolase family protein [Parafrankia colletiae]